MEQDQFFIFKVKVENEHFLLLTAQVVGSAALN